MGTMWVVVAGKGEAASLQALLGFDPEQVVVLAVGPREVAEDAARSARSVRWIDTANAPGEGFAACAAKVLSAEAPAAVVGVSAPVPRAVLGQLAALSEAAVVSNVIAVKLGEGAVSVTRTALADKLIERLEVDALACLLVSPFSLTPQKADPSAVPGAIEQVGGASDEALDAAVSYVERRPISASKLTTADVVVSVGNGIGGADSLALAEQLADVLGAELGCSMPVASDLGLLPHERYIGISGKSISPKLCLAFGVSGTTQHVAGLRNAKTIVCVNKDPKALFFDHADYGIVGDLNEVIPAIVEACE